MMSFQPSTRSLIFLDQLGLGLRPEVVVQLVQTRISQRKLESQAGTPSDRFPVSLPGVAPPTTLKPGPWTRKQRREPQSSASAAQGRAVAGRGWKDGQAVGRMGDDRGTHRVGSVRGARSTPTERQ